MPSRTRLPVSLPLSRTVPATLRVRIPPGPAGRTRMLFSSPLTSISSVLLSGLVTMPTRPRRFPRARAETWRFTRSSVPLAMTFTALPVASNCETVATPLAEEKEAASRPAPLRFTTEANAENSW